LAVIPVVLYHAGFGLFRGGRVGVDASFVISGYLITGNIYMEMSAGRFSVIDVKLNNGFGFACGWATVSVDSFYRCPG
jgi:peptidoglycan/LPS O-acetylase OafA/YrhL